MSTATENRSGRFSQADSRESPIPPKKSDQTITSLAVCPNAFCFQREEGKTTRNFVNRWTDRYQCFYFFFSIIRLLSTDKWLVQPPLRSDVLLETLNNATWLAGNLSGLKRFICFSFSDLFCSCYFEPLPVSNPQDFPFPLFPFFLLFFTGWTFAVIRVNLFRFEKKKSRKK